jgi:hypothetical protein
MKDQALKKVGCLHYLTTIQHENEWEWLGFNKALFTRTGRGPDFTFRL